MPEIHFAHFLIGEDFLGRALCDDLAFADDIGLFADVERLPHVVIRQQHAEEDEVADPDAPAASSSLAAAAAA